MDETTKKRNTVIGCLSLVIILIAILIIFFACVSGESDIQDTSTTDATIATEEATNTEPDPLDELSTEEKNAYSSAMSYLNYAGFSREGLIKQLEFDKYPKDAAEKAVTLIEDNGEVDWEQECFECAENYMSVSSFSKERLVDQLKYEGFTDDQINAIIDEVYQ